MSLLQTTADLIKDALRLAGEKIDGSSDFTAEALDAMNNAYLTMISGGNIFDMDLAEPWSWARARYPLTLVLKPAYSATVALTQDSATGAFAVAPVESQVGKFLKVTSRPEYYRIAAHLAGDTAFTLDSAYADETTAAVAAQAIQLDYTLSATDMLRLAGPMSVYRTQVQNKNDYGVIELVDANVFERNYPLYKLAPAVPTAYCIVSSGDGTVTVRFNAYPGARTKVEVPYIPIPAALTNDDLSIPIIPRAFRRVLSYATAFFLCLSKEDSKQADYSKLASAQLQAMIRANRKEQAATGKNRGRLIARADDFGTLNWPTSGSGNSGV